MGLRSFDAELMFSPLRLSLDEEGIHSQVSGITTRMGQLASLCSESSMSSRLRMPRTDPDPDNQFLVVKGPWPFGFFIQPHIDCHGCIVSGNKTKI